MKGYSAYPKAPALLEPYHQIVYYHIWYTHLRGGLSHYSDAVSVFYNPTPSWLGHRTVFVKQSYPLQKCSQCILQPHLQPTGPKDTSWEAVLLLCRNAVGVFYNSSWLDHRTLVGRQFYPSAEMQSVYSTTPADWTTGHLLGGSLSPLQRCSRCISQPPTTTTIADWAGLTGEI